VLVGQQRYEGIRRVIVVGAGKAGAPMAEAVQAVLGDRVHGGIVIVKEGHLGTTNGEVGPITLVEGAHPVPDERNPQAASQLAAALHDLQPDDLVLVLVSGGGSALLTLPSPPLTLGDLQALTGALLRCGASIGEINTLRKHCTALGGGQLARLAAPAQVAALIVSDVIGSPLDVIASGPTAPDPSTFAAAWAIVQRYGLAATLPPAIITRLQQGMAGEHAETPKANDPLWARVHNHLIASNVVAGEAAIAAARNCGFNAMLLTTFLDGEAREMGRMAAALARELALREGPLARPALLVIGGETTVTLRGDGRGGRNQEVALGAVDGIAGLEGVLVIALATDGGDGPTDAAGAVATGTTRARATTLGLDPHAHLAMNDAYNFFAPLHDLLLPGPTLTNVNDLLFIAVL
jgi:hydroxypyruvate reductase